MRAANEIQQIFFDLHGTLIDSRKMRRQYQLGLSQYLAQHYSGTIQQWQRADEQIMHDWDAYHADLHFGGDEGMEDFYESLYRITRALFRAAAIPEPTPTELTALSRRLPVEASRGVNALYPEAASVLRELVQRGYHLGIATYIPAAQAEAILQGCGVRDCFQAPLVGIDTAGQYERDARYFQIAARLADTDPAHCLLVDDDPLAIAGAAAAGMTTVFVQRNSGTAPPSADQILAGSLLPLLDFC